MRGPQSIRRAALGRVSATVGVAVAVLILPAIGLAAAKPPNLGTAGGYALVANTTITNTGVTHIDGNLALVGPSVTGFGPGVITGKKDIGNAAANAAEADVLAAHHDATDAAPVTEMAGDLGGETLVPGVYHFGVAATLQRNADARRPGQDEPAVRLPDRFDADHRHGRARRADPRRRRLRGVLGGGQLGDDRHGHFSPGQPDGPRQHHHEHRAHPSASAEGATAAGHSPRTGPSPSTRTRSSRLRAAAPRRLRRRSPPRARHRPGPRLRPFRRPRSQRPSPRRPRRVRDRHIPWHRARPRRVSWAARYQAAVKRLRTPDHRSSL